MMENRPNWPDAADLPSRWDRRGEYKYICYGYGGQCDDGYVIVQDYRQNEPDAYDRAKEFLNGSDPGTIIVVTWESYIARWIPAEYDKEGILDPCTDNWDHEVQGGGRVCDIRKMPDGTVMTKDWNTDGA